VAQVRECAAQLTRQAKRAGLALFMIGHVTKEGAIAGMIAGIVFTASYIIYFTFINPELNNVDYWWFGISPEGIGTVGMLLNFAVALGVAKFTKRPPVEIQELVENIRVPGKSLREIRAKQADLGDEEPGDQG
jgi:Na+/proline symporter